MSSMSNLVWQYSEDFSFAKFGQSPVSFDFEEEGGGGGGGGGVIAPQTPLYLYQYNNLLYSALEISPYLSGW